MKQKNVIIGKLTKIYGYSLFEMLLVIAIFGIVAVMVNNLIKQHEQEVKIKKTVLQIEQFFLSANAYRVVKGFWPTDDTAEYFEDNYMPRGVLQGPWGNKYIYYPQPVAGKDEKRFRVETKVPNNELAKAISIKLPNAKVLEDRVTVAAEISLPFDYNSATSAVNLMQIGNIKIGSTDSIADQFRFDNQGIGEIKINDIQCPSPLKPQIVILPSDYRMLKGSKMSDFYLKAAPEIASIGIKEAGCTGSPSSQCNFTYAYQAWLCLAENGEQEHVVDGKCNSTFPVGPLSGVYRGMKDGRILFSNGGVYLNYLVFCVPPS